MIFLELAKTEHIFATIYFFLSHINLYNLTFGVYSERTKHEVEYLADSMNKLSTCWEGPAWAAFQTTVNEDIEYMIAVCNEIAALVSNLSESQKKYAQGEKQNYDSMNSIWI